MAFDAANLKLVDNMDPQVFKYWSNDLTGTITASGYFNSAYEKFHKGDLILIAGDVDGTAFTTQLAISSASAAATVTTVDLATATLTFNSKYVLTASLVAAGTAETQYVVASIPGMVTKVYGVLNISGLGSGGTSTVTITVPTTGAIATLPFLQDTAAGAVIEDTTITAHTALLAGGVIQVTTDGTGSHTGVCRVTIEITPT
jgi:hypothetical protein